MIPQLLMRSFERVGRWVCCTEVVAEVVINRGSFMIIELETWECPCSPGCCTTEENNKERGVKKHDEEAAPPLLFVVHITVGSWRKGQL